MPGSHKISSLFCIFLALDMNTRVLGLGLICCSFASDTVSHGAPFSNGLAHRVLFAASACTRQLSVLNHSSPPGKLRHGLRQPWGLGDVQRLFSTAGHSPAAALLKSTDISHTVGKACRQLYLQRPFAAESSRTCMVHGSCRCSRSGNLPRSRAPPAVHAARTMLPEPRLLEL
ncbi:hypothetical protein C2E23DRAFT_238406 [Lenzites betulinus]|nr:hypothetical protein C2E23DRAFT_238406 [Lenzites betulinus]